MKNFFQSVMFFIQILISAFKSERNHHGKDFKFLESGWLVAKNWRILWNISKDGDQVWVVNSEGIPVDPYDLGVEWLNDREYITPHDVVAVGKKPSGWYYYHLTDGLEAIPAPWLNKFYNI